MTPDFYAILAQVLYALIAVGVSVGCFQRSGLGFSAWLLYVIERPYVGLMFHWRANRRCSFPEGGPAIIIANHRSPVDPMLIWMNNHLGARRRRTRVIGFMTAREYCQSRGLNWICRAMQSIPVDRDGKDMQPAREALDRLKKGCLLGVFPEGRINTGPGLLEGDAGIAWLALHARVPVYPVYLHNSPVGQSMIHPFYTPTRVRVTYGDPIDLSAYYERKKTHTLLVEVTDLLMRRLAELGGVTYAKDARPGGRPASPQHAVVPVRSTG